MSRNQREALPIQRGEEASSGEKNKYTNVIARARARGRQRQKPQDLVDTPRFDALSDTPRQIQGLYGEEDAGLSDETSAGLAAVGAAMEARAAQDADKEEEEPATDGPLSAYLNSRGELELDAIVELFGVDRLKAAALERLAYPERSSDPQEIMRAAIEQRCRALDIGQYLMNGFLTQEVPIIESGEHAGLVVEFRTITDQLEVFVDRMLSEEASRVRTLREDGQKFDIEMSNREYTRRTAEWALAAYVFSYQGRRWPAPVDTQGQVSEDAMRRRLVLVRQLPSHIFNLLSSNLSWFLERSVEHINIAVLGNG